MDGRPLALPLSPARSLPPALRLFLQQRELDLLLHRIDAIHDHAYFLAQAISLMCTLADDLACILVIKITIIGERSQRHQPFDEQIGEFHKESKFGHTDAKAIK